MPITFTVYGVPQSQGSMRAFVRPGAKFASITSDNKKLKPWRQEVAACALAELERTKGKCYARDVPVRLDICFYFASKPKRKGQVYKVTAPDLDKLLRAIFDALTGKIYVDDSQVVGCLIWKYYGMPARVEIKADAMEFSQPDLERQLSFASMVIKKARAHGIS